MGHTKDQYNTIHSHSALVFFFGAGTGDLPHSNTLKAPKPPLEKRREWPMKVHDSRLLTPMGIYGHSPSSESRERLQVPLVFDPRF